MSISSTTHGEEGLDSSTLASSISPDTKNSFAFPPNSQHIASVESSAPSALPGQVLVDSQQTNASAASPHPTHSYYSSIAHSGQHYSQQRQNIYSGGYQIYHGGTAQENNYVQHHDLQLRSLNHPGSNPAGPGSYQNRDYHNNSHQHYSQHHQHHQHLSHHQNHHSNKYPPQSHRNLQKSINSQSQGSSIYPSPNTSGPQAYNLPQPSLPFQQLPPPLPGAGAGPASATVVPVPVAVPSPGRPAIMNTVSNNASNGVPSLSANAPIFGTPDQMAMGPHSSYPLPYPPQPMTPFSNQPQQYYFGHFPYAQNPTSSGPTMYMNSHGNVSQMQYSQQSMSPPDSHYSTFTSPDPSLYSLHSVPGPAPPMVMVPNNQMQVTLQPAMMNRAPPVSPVQPISPIVSSNEYQGSAVPALVSSHSNRPLISGESSLVVPKSAKSILNPAAPQFTASGLYNVSQKIAHSVATPAIALPNIDRQSTDGSSDSDEIQTDTSNADSTTKSPTTDSCIILLEGNDLSISSEDSIITLERVASNASSAASSVSSVQPVAVQAPNRMPWFSDPSAPFPSRYGKDNRRLLRARIRQLSEMNGISIDEVLANSEKYQINRNVLDLTKAQRKILENTNVKRIGSRNKGRTAGSEQQSISEPATPLISVENEGSRAEVGPHVRSQTARSWADVVNSHSNIAGDKNISTDILKSSSALQNRTQTQKSALPPINRAGVSPVGSSGAVEPVSPSTASSVSGSSAQTSEATDIDEQQSSVFEPTPPTLLPRGLVNMGNMCFMNSILQILLYCVPFYSFIESMSKKLSHQFNSQTPILDSLILFMGEFNSGSRNQFSTDPELDNLISSPQKLFGEPFIPEFVYDALRGNALFANMRRGHQEDAEEFLGFLLDGLHEEFMAVAEQIQKKLDASGSSWSTEDLPLDFVESALEELNISRQRTNSTGQDENGATNGPVDGWLEVGRKQKVAVTRTTTVSNSPVTQIFGGQFRSVIRAAHQKPSVTIDPYQRLQLDISDHSIRTIEDALANIAQPEVISHYKSKQGDMVEANKQTLLEKLPRVLILHLKRFQFTMEEGSGYASVEKISKTIGYKRELEIPRECLSPHHGETGVKYQLFGVVYHHGKSTEGGHYTVDARYQAGNKWINFDDVNLKTVDVEAVETEYEEEPKKQRSEGERTAYLLFYERIHEDNDPASDATAGEMTASSASRNLSGN
ncbi:uncharacterized protein V1516DRAFT_689836 [Lipomyces oligophaga]|uniref:uncharacterized protein n=1 Tax=Lipomyces oligophaga TaxID=45792 RepID=UPI0034CDEB8F